MKLRCQLSVIVWCICIALTSLHVESDLSTYDAHFEIIDIIRPWINCRARPSEITIHSKL